MWSQCASILLLLTPVAEQMDNTLIICRIYACIADMLGYMAGEGGGIRAGPAANLSWQTAFQLLEVRVGVTQPSLCNVLVNQCHCFVFFCY